MASYSISLKPSVEKDLRPLPKSLVSRVMRRIDGLKTDRLYRVRVGDYRIVYEVDTQIKQVTIHYVRHRREVYRTL